VNRLCLDTSAYSHLMRGEPAAVDSVRRATWVGVCSTVLGELFAGFRLGRRRRENESVLARFLEEPVVHALEVDGGAASHYADIVIALRRNGTPVPTNDIWIASVAAREGATVLTYDSHFAAIDRVSSQILTPG